MFGVAGAVSSLSVKFRCCCSDRDGENQSTFRTHVQNNFANRARTASKQTVFCKNNCHSMHEIMSGNGD